MENIIIGSKVKEVKKGYERIEQEKKNEQKMLIDGRNRFHKEINTSKAKHQNGKQKEPTESTTIYGQQLLQKGIEKVNVSIDKFITSVFGSESNTKKYATSATYLVKCIPVQELEKNDVNKWSSVSLIALKTVLDSITTGCTQTKASVKIGNSLEDEARLLFFKENDAKTYSRTRQWLKSKNNYRYKKRIYVYAMNKHNLEFGVWPKVDKIHIGMTLIYLIMEATGLIKLQKKSEGRLHTPIYVQATEETMKWIDNAKLHSEALKPMRMPMLVCPRKWTNPFNGGYLTHSFKIMEDR